MDAIDELKMIKYGATTDHLRNAILALADRVEVLEEMAKKFDWMHYNYLRDKFATPNIESDSPAASKEWQVWKVWRRPNRELYEVWRGREFIRQLNSGEEENAWRRVINDINKRDLLIATLKAERGSHE